MVACYQRDLQHKEDAMSDQPTKPTRPELQSNYDLRTNPDDYSEWYDKDDVVNFADEWEEFATVLREAVQELANRGLGLLGFIPDGWDMPLGFSQVAAQYRELAEPIVEAAKETTDGRES